MAIEKLKSLGPVWSYRLKGTANSAHLAHFGGEWAELAVLFSWYLQNWAKWAELAVLVSW